MAKKRLLTFSSDGRWRKQIDGKMRYFGRGDSANDLRGYREAEKRYLNCLAEREKTKPVETPASNITVADSAEAYLQHQHNRVQVVKDLTPSSWCRSSQAVNLFVAHFDSAKRMNTVSELDLDGFRNATLSMGKVRSPHETISLATAKNFLCIVKHFIEWCYRRFLMERLPRNLSEFAALTLPPPRVKTFTRDELKLLWLEAQPRTRLFMALGLNCGFGQSDISDLMAEHWNRETDIIKHPRSKTKIVGEFRLWPITATLLREHARPATSPTDLLLAGENGLPLVHSELVDGKLKKTDAVRSAFTRLQNATDINGHRGFYTLRKTGANEIEQINPLVTYMFLAQSERGMKKHYARPHWDALDTAVTEMGRRLEIEQWGRRV